MKVNGQDYSKEQLVKALQVYAITDRSWLKPGEDLMQPVEEALRAGVGMMQLREKSLAPNALREEAIRFRDLCAKYRVPSIMNDDVELCVQLDLDGVHVGQSDMEPGKVRELIGPDKLLGVSAKTAQQALLAEREGANYLGVGAVFHTGSKHDASELSHDVLEEICQAVSIPVVAIGGITKDNLTLLQNRGIAGVAVISAVFGQEDISKAVFELFQKTDAMLKA